MGNDEPLLECVPNFSEGRNEAVITAIANELQSVAGARLLHIDQGISANRTVMTFAGQPEAVVEAAWRGIKKAAELIDMRLQDGAHPRIGATDVCPLIPLRNMTMEEAVDWSRLLAERVGKELGIPVFLYENSATASWRRALPDIRLGQYEGLAKKMQQSEWLPDFGPTIFQPAVGATVIGARKLLVAFNISINSRDVRDAIYIAERIRESGYRIVEGSVKKHIPGRLKKLRAIGWFMDEFECAQVSMNLLDYQITSPLKAWEVCSELAAELGLSLIGSELIGLMPEVCLLEAGAYHLRAEAKAEPFEREQLIEAGIAHLKLDKVKSFDPDEKILEYNLARVGF